MLHVFTFLLCLVAAMGFMSPSCRQCTKTTTTPTTTTTCLSMNPFKGLGDAFSNLDDVIDDFFNKRMGNGEIFYGKRKVNPSGRVEGPYNGMGLSDKQRIDDTLELKALRMEQRRLREEARKKEQQS